MTYKEIYHKLDYNNLVDVQNIDENEKYIDFTSIGVDKVYFSGEYPAIFFKEIINFDLLALKQIARIQHLAWNYRKIMFLVVVSTTEVRVYNCSCKPFNYEHTNSDLEQELSKIELVRENVNELTIIKTIFSRIAVDTGALWITDNNIKNKIDIQQRIDRFLIKSLLKAAQELKKLKLNEDIIHALLMRSIFIMYLEDKGAVSDTKLYNNIRKDATSYLDILQSKENTYELFVKMEHHFNGNVFPILNGEERKVNKDHLRIIRHCLLDGDLSMNPKLFGEWRLFRFDIIQIELLSEIYENFITEFKSKRQEESGQYYTPPSLVDLVLNENLKSLNSKNWNIKILDPACGSGIFLVEFYKRLIKIWKKANPNKLINFHILKEILLKNIYGIEIDKFAIRVTTFSLYLTILEHLNPKTLWIDESLKFPHLINDSFDSSLEKQGKNLLRADTIGELTEDKIPKVDLVIGNPPFGSKIKQKSLKNYCSEYGFGKDMVIPFLHKSIKFTDFGQICLIFNTKILTNTKQPFQNFRKWLFNSTYVHKIYNLSIFRKAPKLYGGQLFTSAVGPISIVFFQKKKPEISTNTIEYWAPKTFVKNNIVEGVIIDSTDIKFLPRSECEKPDSKIWKIAMWGNISDFRLYEDLLQKYITIDKYFKKNSQIDVGVGLELSEPKNKYNQKIKNLAHHVPESITPFYTKKSKSQKLNEVYFRRLGKLEAYKSPHILIKEGVTGNRVISSFIDYECSFYKGIIGVYSKNKNTKGLKLLNTYLNSNIVRYLAFLTTSSWGIERDVIKYKELFSLPYIIPINEKIENKLIELADIAISEQNQFFDVDLSFINDKVDNIISNSLDYKSRILIDDMINITMDLFQKGQKSIALKPTTIEDNKQYSKVIQKELSKFLENKLNIEIKFSEISTCQPLNIIKVIIDSKSNKISRFDSDSYLENLKIVDKYLLTKKSQNIYVKKQFKYFYDNIAIIVKPNQKRFWSRSMAINDSVELISEILKMGNE